MSTTLLAPRDAAKRLGLSTSRIIQLDRDGQLRARRDSAGRRFFDAADVETLALARERRKQTATYAGATYAGAGRRQAYRVLPLSSDGRTFVLKMTYAGQEQMRIFSYHPGLVPETASRSFSE